MGSSLYGPFAKDLVNYTPRLTPGDGVVRPIPTYYWRVDWWRQSPPYDNPLPWSAQKREILSDNGSDPVWPSFATVFDNYDTFSQLCYDLAANKCFDKLVGEVGQASQWANNLKEMSDSMSSIVSAAAKLRKFTKKLNRFDWAGAAEELGLNSVPKGLKPLAKHHGDNWLKYHFGWEPLVKDIGAAAEVLTAPLPSKRVKVRASEQIVRSVPNFGGTQTAIIKTGVTAVCTIRVTNPNLYLAQQTGFVNPLSVIWEAVPYSFVVDWFVNVGQFLSSMTAFAGVSLEKPSTGFLQKITGSFIRHSSWTWVYSTSTVYAGRVLSIKEPVIRMKPFKGVSASRGVTAISLLLQQMKH